LRAEIGLPNVKVFEQTTRSEALSEQIDQAAELDEHRKGRPRLITAPVTRAALVAAQRRGVRVEIIVPGRQTDAMVVRKASRSRWADLLEAGIAIYEYQPTMYHTKVMVVDDLWTSVGSTNFDNRSFRLNDEANLNILDAEFALGQTRLFEADKARSKEMTLDRWRGRPWHQRAADWLAGLLRLQL
jgi:cardiolipin synthase